jgi:hypothetical protein
MDLGSISSEMAGSSTNPLTPVVLDLKWCRWRVLATNVPVNLSQYTPPALECQEMIMMNYRRSRGGGRYRFQLSRANTSGLPEVHITDRVRWEMRHPDGVRTRRSS